MSQPFTLPEGLNAIKPSFKASQVTAEAGFVPAAVNEKASAGGAQRVMEWQTGIA